MSFCIMYNSPDQRENSIKRRNISWNDLGIYYLDFTGRISKPSALKIQRCLKDSTERIIKGMNPFRHAGTHDNYHCMNTGLVLFEVEPIKSIASRSFAFL